VLLILIWAFTPLHAWAGLSSANVAVVVNQNSWASRAIANEYIALRGIPSTNVIYLSDVDAFERTDVATFRESILQPTLTLLQQRGVLDQIDCITYSADLPTAIDVRSDLKDQKLPRVFTPVASINGLTYLYSQTLIKNPSYMLLNSNHYYRRPVRGDDGKFSAPGSVGFRSKQQWDSAGDPVAAGGKRYILSTVLAVTSGRGNSVAESIARLRSSVAADGTRPAGTIYYMTNADVRSRTRKGHFDSAIAGLKNLGATGVVMEGNLPKEKPDVIGAMLGIAGFNWKASGAQIAPGSICEHLTSYGGMMGESAGQTPLTELLRYGAAGASGTVTEPFAIQAKFPDPYIHVHYLGGATLAEAFYQSVAGPYQLLIVGDPLCAPWAPATEFTIEGIAEGQAVQGVVEITPKASVEKEETPASFDVYLDGRRIAQVESGKTFRIATTGLPNGAHSLRVTAVAATALQTQTAKEVAFQIDNPKRGAITASLVGEAPHHWDQPLQIQLQSENATSLIVRHNERTIGRVEGSIGQIEIDPLLLGPGPVRLQPIAALPGTLVLGDPIDVEISPPPATAMIESLQSATVQPGIELIVGTRSRLVDSTRDGKWLTQAKLAEGQSFALHGVFDVSSEEIYQLQFRGDDLQQLMIDGQTVWNAKDDQTASERWRFLPVPLAIGRHRFQAIGNVQGKPKVDIRFGGQGAPSLDGQRFQHLADEPPEPEADEVLIPAKE